MPSRDKYGNYVNEKGVTIKVNTDKNGNDHVSFYGSSVDASHDAAHVNINYQKKSWSSETHDSSKSNSSNGSGGCYLTTACMKHFKEDFDDSCYELRVLRWFRDNFVSKEDIDHYYDIAPTIVIGIDNEPQSDMVYDYIYDNVIDACVSAIEEGNYEFAYKRYKSSILSLEEAFAKPLMQKNGKILSKVNL